MKFHERFDIAVGLEEAKKRFGIRLRNDGIDGFVYNNRFHDSRRIAEIEIEIASALGDRFNPNEQLTESIGQNFLRNLQALEVVYATTTWKSAVEAWIG